MLPPSVVLMGILSSPLFTDVSNDVGINFSHHASYLITGQAIADVNRDGWPDLILTSSDGENGILLNQQGTNFITAPFSNDIRMPGHQSGGVSVADYDNDGWPDIYLAGNGSNHLFHNNNGQGFTDVTLIAGVGHDGRDESSAWADFNNDGWLDLIVVGFPVVDHPEPLNPVNVDALFFNNGDGSFSNLSTMLDIVKTRGPGFAVSTFDFDQDGDLDIYVANDKLWGNAMWRNDGPGCGGWCFTDVAEATGTRRPVFGMGISVADFDNDLDDDLLFSSISEQVLLQSQWSQGQLIYNDISIEAGVSLNAIGWSTLFFDMNNDSWQDAFIATFNVDTHNADRVYMNLHDGSFADVSVDSGASDGRPTIGAACGDFNRDGKMDLVVGDHGSGYRLLQNITESNNNWVQFIPDGGHSVNRDALGTVLLVTRNNGLQTRHRLFSGDAIGSGSERLIHAGVGSSETIDIEVIWPDGVSQQLASLSVNQRHRLVHPGSELISQLGFEG